MCEQIDINSGMTNAVIIFNGKSLYLKDFLDSYKEKCKKTNEFIEILPSIYCNSKINTLYGIGKIFYIIKKAFKNDDNYIIYNKNKRDKFELFDLKDTKNCYNKTSSQDVSPKTKNEYVATERLPYPSLLGGGCEMWNIFTDVGLTTFRDFCEVAYKPLSYEQVLQITSKNELLNNTICRNGRCASFIKKMLDGTFTPIYEDQDRLNAIRISDNNGKVSLSEGKHRICAAKRFGVKKIPATVTYYNYNYTPHNSVVDTLLVNHISQNKMRCEEILNECNRIYKNIGLSDDAIHQLNESVSDNDYITFLEQQTGKNILEILGVVVE